uniref:BTB domain-containing protein n=1 Tax=Panagrellus redivivus TaxID=6233 RepID=A0A7E4VVA0_PANRE
MTVFEDAFNISLEKNANGTFPEGKMASAHRPIMGSKGISWWAEYYVQEDHVFISIHASGGCTNFDGRIQCGQHNFELYGEFQTDYVSVIFGFLHGGENCVITCSGKFSDFDSNICFKPTATPLYEFVNSTDHCPYDMMFKVGDSGIEAHRALLAIVSPVFAAMFNANTKEADTGVVQLEDCSLETVQNVLELCYGCDGVERTAKELVDMLKFVDKYGITVLVDKLEACLPSHITVEGFAPVAEYAWIYEKPFLQAQCARFFIDNHAQLAESQEFHALPAPLLICMMGLVITYILA